jgi:hypothetical protein
VGLIPHKYTVLWRYCLVGRPLRKYILSEIADACARCVAPRTERTAPRTSDVVTQAALAAGRERELPRASPAVRTAGVFLSRSTHSPRPAQVATACTRFYMVPRICAVKTMLRRRRLASCGRRTTGRSTEGPSARDAALPVLTLGSASHGAPPEAAHRSPRCAAGARRTMVRAPVFAGDQVRRHRRFGRPHAAALRGRPGAMPGASGPASEGLIGEGPLGRRMRRGLDGRVPCVGARRVNRQSTLRSFVRAAAGRAT